MSETVIIREWPIQLTFDQLKAFTNWSEEHIKRLTSERKIRAERRGRRGCLLWYRPSVETHIAQEFGNEPDEIDFA